MTRFCDRKIGIHVMRAFLLGLGLTALVAMGRVYFTLDDADSWRLVAKSEAAVVKPARLVVEAPSDLRRSVSHSSRDLGVSSSGSGDTTRNEVDTRTRRLLALLAIGLLLEAGR